MHKYEQRSLLYSFSFLMNFRVTEPQMEAHLRPAVSVKSWGGAQNKKPMLMTHHKHIHIVLCSIF